MVDCDDFCGLSFSLFYVGIRAKEAAKTGLSYHSLFCFDVLAITNT
jgi:hypothetical protein